MHPLFLCHPPMGEREREGEERISRCHWPLTVFPMVFTNMWSHLFLCKRKKGCGWMQLDENMNWYFFFHFMDRYSLFLSLSSMLIRIQPWTWRHLELNGFQLPSLDRILHKSNFLSVHQMTKDSFRFFSIYFCFGVWVLGGWVV